LVGGAGTFTVVFDSGCKGEASGTFTVTRTGKTVRLQGAWSGTITDAGGACPCGVGATTSEFVLYV
jgi:hypothetical protein